MLIKLEMIRNSGIMSTFSAMPGYYFNLPSRAAVPSIVPVVMLSIRSIIARSESGAACVT